MAELFKDFTNLYPVSKTLRFELIPEGETLYYLEKNGSSRIFVGLKSK